MPLYMDVHNLQGATTVQVDQAHAADLEEQGKYGVEYLKYWFNESHGKAFCLVDAPSPEAAQLVHRQAHGQIAERIIEVRPEFAEAFLGGGETDPSGAVLASSGAGNERDSAIRTILFTDIVGSTNEAMGDDAGMALLGIHNTIVRDALAAEDGREVKHTGDGIMASFVSPVAAVRCATRVQRALDKHREEQTEHPLKVRIGAAAGEPVEREHDLFGATGGAAVFPRAAQSNSGVERGCRVVPRKGPALQRPGRCFPKRFQSPNPSSRCRMVRRDVKRRGNPIKPYNY